MARTSDMHSLEFKLPDLGEGLTEAEIVRWLVEVGDLVSIDQPVVEVETAKAAVEVPVPFAGVVTRLHGEPGQSVRVGTALISVEPQAGTEPRYAGFTEPGVVTASVAGDDTATAGASASASGNVLIGYGTTSETRRARGRRRRGRERRTASPRALAVACRG